MAKDKKHEKKHQQDNGSTISVAGVAKSTLSDAERARLYDPTIIVIDEKTLPPEERQRLMDEIAALPPPSIRSGDMKAVHVPPLAPVADAVARLEQTAGTERAVQAHIDAIADEKMAVERLRPLARPGESLVQAVERLEALARTVSAPAVGLIVQETAPSQYKVHVLESDANGVRVWDTEPGDAMPWHAAKVLVDRVVETKLTPEDKR